MFWLAIRTLRRAPRRLVLGAVGTTFPVAILAATLFYVGAATQEMTKVALRPVQIEDRALGGSFEADMNAVSAALGKVPGVSRAEPFGAADVVVSVPGNPAKWSARLIAVNSSYLKDRPWIGGDTSLQQGSLLDQSLRRVPGFEQATSITINFPGDAPPLNLDVPVGGTTDLRRADTFFAIPYGDVQGDLVSVARSLVIDYAIFEQKILPLAQTWSTSGGPAASNPGSSDLPPIGLETHIDVDHSAYPGNPADAVKWTQKLRRTLERQAGGGLLVADNAEEPLSEAGIDATNAKILFLLLGVPGALCAAALGMSAASALAEAGRREDALLRLRGATGRQIGRLAALQSAIAGTVGALLGLGLGAAAAGAVTGKSLWREGLAGGPASPVVLSIVAGVLLTVVRLLRLRSAGRSSEVAIERRYLELGWSPLWLRAKLDYAAIAAGAAILALNVAAGGLTPGPVEGSVLALSFFILMAPILLWLGLTLLAVRALLAWLRRIARSTGAPQASWGRAGIHWLGRRPSRTAVVLVLGSLALAFGTQVLTFAATYRSAKTADNAAAVGSDLRLTPRDPLAKLPDLGPEIAATSAFRIVPARAGSDRKNILAIDLSGYQAVSTQAPQMLEGSGPEALASEPNGVLVASEIAESFGLTPGDLLPVTAYPDDYENSTNLKLKMVGVYRSFPPTNPPISPPEMVVTTQTVRRANVLPPDYYLARVADGFSAGQVAHRLRTGPLKDTFFVTRAGQGEQRGLTALNLAGLGTIESTGAALVAAVGISLLGMFIVLERKREFAILRAAGASTSQILTLPALEGAIAILGSLAIGVPVGLALGLLSVRILGLFFFLPPPLLTVPFVPLAEMAALTLLASGVALAVAMRAVTRSKPASVLRGL